MAKGDGLALNSPKFLAMKAIIESPAGQAAMEEAVANGLPPLCGVDDILTSLIIGYAEDQALMSAGSIVAEYMRHAGYTQGQRKDCPAGCTAKSGATFTQPA